MGKRAHDDVLDAPLTYIKTNATRMTYCSAEPANFTEADATYKLADLTIDSSDFTGPANGTVSGRKLTVNAQSAVDVDSDAAPCTHVALLDVANSKVLWVTTAPSIALNEPGQLESSAWDIEFRDPA